MLTIENLKALGVNTDEGVERCVNNEAFYLRMVETALRENRLEQLRSALAEGDLDTAFECAHALKGVLGSLAITKLFETMSEMTEELRSRKDIDYSGYMAVVDEEFAKLQALLED